MRRAGRINGAAGSPASVRLHGYFPSNRERNRESPEKRLPARAISQNFCNGFRELPCCENREAYDHEQRTFLPPSSFGQGSLPIIRVSHHGSKAPSSRRSSCVAGSECRLNWRIINRLIRDRMAHSKDGALLSRAPLPIVRATWRRGVRRRAGERAQAADRLRRAVPVSR